MNIWWSKKCFPIFFQLFVQNLFLKFSFFCQPLFFLAAILFFSKKNRNLYLKYFFLWFLVNISSYCTRYEVGHYYLVVLHSSSTSIYLSSSDYTVQTFAIAKYEVWTIMMMMMTIFWRDIFVFIFLQNHYHHYHHHHYRHHHLHNTFRYYLDLLPCKIWRC